eukprot:TRINITY_DN3708_c1_g6_i1.p1 TRINITY_DN3708_c1_g6~~TRINITY_DN3708_c1_g6_i1.p1  ORF type:complete len:274 (+),score=87.28 TRINITY_DN3708_c1_g6_i1:168-989(+)
MTGPPPYVPSGRPVHHHQPVHSGYALQPAPPASSCAPSPLYRAYEQPEPQHDDTASWHMVQPHRVAVHHPAPVYCPHPPAQRQMPPPQQQSQQQPQPQPQPQTGLAPPRSRMSPPAPPQPTQQSELSASLRHIDGGHAPALRVPVSPTAHSDWVSPTASPRPPVDPPLPPLSVRSKGRVPPAAAELMARCQDEAVTRGAAPTSVPPPTLTAQEHEPAWWQGQNPLQPADDTDEWYEPPAIDARSPVFTAGQRPQSPASEGSFYSPRGHYTSFQ